MALADQAGVPGPQHGYRLPNALYGNLKCSRLELILGWVEGAVMVALGKNQEGRDGVLVFCE